MSSEDGRQTFTTRDGRELKRPRSRQKTVLRSRYQDLVDGKLDIEDLDEEELFRGRLRGADGFFRGRPPNAIPWKMHKAYVDHVGQRLERTIVNSMPEILEQLIRIATGEIGGDTGVAMDVQAKAAMYLADRILGKPTEKQQVEVSVTAKWEEALSSGDLVVDIPEGDIIEAELVESDPPALPAPSFGRAPDTAGRAKDGVAAEATKAEPAPRPRPKTNVKLK